jgi:WD40 repeat protein
MFFSHGRVNWLCLLGLVALACGLLGGDAFSRSVQQKDVTKVEQPKKGSADEQTIRSLIDQLGDDSFDKREAAEKRLIEIGASAAEQLGKAAKDSPDPEIRQRAAQALQGIGSAREEIGSEFCLFERKFAETKSPQGKKLLTRVALAPDASMVYATGAGPPHAWDFKTGTEVFGFDNRPGVPCWSLAISGDGARLLTGCGGGSAHLFDAKTGKKVRAFAGHPGGVWGVALLADGKRALTAGADAAINLWEIETGKRLGGFAGVRDSVRCMAVSPDGKLLAAGHFGQANGPGTVRIWDIEQAIEVRSMEGHGLEITGVIFSPDGKTLLSSSYDKTLRLWDVGTGKELKRFAGHLGPVEAAAFTADGRRIVSCGSGADTSMRLWNVESGTQIAEGPRPVGGFTSVAILPDGKRCVTVAGEGPVRLWRWLK